MKILRISLRNIASLAGTHTIDFTRDPLRAAGLYAISGATGSGKSTLLDALCLALYDGTPRLRDVGRLAELTNGERQNDPRNLLRRGSGEGFAEVAFVGVDGLSYTARWLARRARERVDGGLQPTEMTLYRGDVANGNGPIEQGGRKSEVLPAIEAKIGLSFAQFTRAVLLAQNDFAAFLKADDRERAEILQALTGTERFEMISIAVFTRFSGEQQLVRDIENRLAGNAPLDPAARATAESASAAAESNWKGLSTKVQVRETHAAWFRRSRELTGAMDAAGKNLLEKRNAREAAAGRRAELERTDQAAREARSLWDTEQGLRLERAKARSAEEEAVEVAAQAGHEVRTKRERLGAADTAVAVAKKEFEEARPKLIQVRELEAKLAPLLKHLADATGERQLSEKKLASATETRDKLLTKRKSLDDECRIVTSRRVAVQAFAGFAPDASAWLHRLDQAKASFLAATKTQKISQDLAKEEARTAKDHAAEREKEVGLRNAAQGAADELAQAEQAVQGRDSEKIVRAREEADAAMNALRELEKRLQTRVQVEGQGAELEREIRALKDERETEAKALAELNERIIPEALRIMEDARHAFDLAEAAVANEAVRLREKLIPGQPCPVCGSREHPHSQQPPVEEAVALRALQTDYKIKEKALRELREKAAALVAIGKNQLERESEKAKAFAEVQLRLQQMHHLEAGHPTAGAILALPAAEQIVALQTQLATQEQSLKHAKEEESAQRQAEKRRDGCRQKRDATQAALAELEKRLAKSALEMEGLRAKKEAADAAKLEADNRFQAALEDLAALFAALTDSRSAWERGPDEFRQNFSDKTVEFSVQEKRLRELAQQIRETDAVLGPGRQAVIDAEGELNSKRIAEANVNGECDKIREQRAQLFAGRAADDVETELADKLRGSTEARELRVGELETANTRLTKTMETRDAMRKRIAELADRQVAAIAALDEWLARFAVDIGGPFGRPQLEPILARDETWIRRERAALASLDGAVREAEGALDVQKQAVEKHLTVRPTTEEEAAVLADLDTERQGLPAAEKHRDETRAALLADNQRRRENAGLAETLRDRQILLLPWAKLNELIGSADGAKFRSIAQRHTLDLLLRDANVQLDLLAPRYRLERLPDSLNLIAIDRDMGDERRSVHSLSGGESFLVSLALALALASLTSNRLRIESLFIDEGFGSLDPETLDTAMNALMRLEAQGRKVGVISHVMEMTDAIPVQIRVVKGRGGASRIAVPGVPEAIPEPETVGHQVLAQSGETAARILEILRQKRAAGIEKVSTRALREELGCTPGDFTAARDALEGQVRTDGRSLTLN